MEKNESGNYVYRILGANYELPHIAGTSKTKNTILMTATILFAQKGYAAISMRDIANAVGIQAPSFRLKTRYGSPSSVTSFDLPC